jgi:AMP nucleosidase
MTSIDQIPAILDELEAIYDSSVANLRAALNAYAREGVRPDRKARDVGAFAYPELRIDYEPEGPPPASARAFARLNQPGVYASSIARPKLYRAYLTEQLSHLIRDYGVDVTAGRSASEISYPYVIDGAELELGGMSTAELSRWFPSTELYHIGDEIADGVYDSSAGIRPLALFDGPRTDFSLARLRHYTGSISSSSCCSPTMSATSTSSSASRLTLCASPIARSPAFRCPAESTKRGVSTMPRRKSPPASGAATRCRPTT